MRYYRNIYRAINMSLRITGRKEQSTSMSQNKTSRLNHRKGTPEEHSHESMRLRSLRSPLLNGVFSEEHLPFKILGYSIPCVRHPQRHDDSLLIQPDTP